MLGLCLLPSHLTWTAQQPCKAVSLHAGFACLPSSSSSFHLPLSLFLHFASTRMEKESWKQIDLVSVLVCLESCVGGKGVAFLSSVSPKWFCISLSEGLNGPPFYIAGNRLTRSADCFMLKLANMIYFESVKALSVSQSHVIAQFCVGHSSCSHKASTDESQPPHCCFQPHSPMWTMKGKKSRLFPWLCESESGRAVTCCCCTKPLEFVQLGMEVILVSQ